MKATIDKFQLAGMTSKAARAQILTISWDKILKDVYQMKSLKFYSIRQQMWELPEHINDSEHSTVLCKFRTSNAGLGNRIPLKGFKESMKICPLCKDLNASHRLDEKHVVFFCTALRDVQSRLGFKTYLKQTKTGSDPLWRYLGGDKCEPAELLRRGKQLQGILEAYHDLVLQAPRVTTIS